VSWATRNFIAALNADSHHRSSRRAYRRHAINPRSAAEIASLASLAGDDDDETFARPMSTSAALKNRATAARERARGLVPLARGCICGLEKGKTLRRHAKLRFSLQPLREEINLAYLYRARDISIDRLSPRRIMEFLLPSFVPITHLFSPSRSLPVAFHVGAIIASPSRTAAKRNPARALSDSLLELCPS